MAPPPRSGENFGCPQCRVKYSISRRQTSPGYIPSCEACDQDFASRDRGDWLVYDRSDAPQLDSSRFINNADRSGPSVRPRSGDGTAAVRAFIDRFTPALTFRARVACREHDRWWEIAFAELVSEHLRYLGFRDGRRGNGMVQSLIDDLLRLVSAGRFSGVTNQFTAERLPGSLKLRTTRLPAG
jgi:hypothetical protein